MKARGVLRALGAIAILVAAACDDNPLSEGRDTTARFRLNPAFANVLVGDSTRINAIAVNEFDEPTGEAVTASACDGKIQVAPDPRRSEFEPPERFVIRGVTVGESCVNISGGGKTATATVNVLPAS